jgi:Protein of unknown function (DUF3108)
MRRLGLLLLIFTMVTAGTAVQAKPLHASSPKQLIPVFQPIIATYDVYVGGIHLLTADILFQEQGGKYRSHVEGHTYGIWHRMLPWDTDLKSQGVIRVDHFVPAEFETHDVYGKKVKITKLHFEKDGDIKAEYDPPNHDQNRGEVTIEQKRGALDPITALLQMLAYLAVEKNCNVTVPVFDGKRRFDITAKDLGTEEIDEEDYGVFKGTARTCTATFTSIAGEWKEQERDKFWKKNDKENGRDPFRIWLGAVSADLPELPVRLDTGSVWGIIVMHMTKWRYATPAELKS